MTCADDLLKKAGFKLYPYQDTTSVDYTIVGNKDDAMLNIPTDGNTAIFYVSGDCQTYEIPLEERHLVAILEKMRELKRWSKWRNWLMNNLHFKSQLGQFDFAAGDIYFNPVFGDLWIVDGDSFVKINDGYSIDLDEPEGFVKVGHVDVVINRKEEADEQNSEV